MTIDAVALAQELHGARLARTSIAPISDRLGGFDVDDAYAVQAAGIDLRLAAGERLVGAKLGFTSQAMRRAMGVAEPNYGLLTDAMVAAPAVDLSARIHPKVEPEVAFVLAEEVTGVGVTAADVLAATEAVAPCLEVVDSRYVGFRFRAVDNVADDSSAAVFVLGDPVPLREVPNLRLVGAVLSVDGEVAATAAGAAVDGHPAAAVAWAARELTRRRGRGLEAGWVVLSGGLTAPVDLVAGRTVRCEVDRLGSVELYGEER